MNPPKVTNQDYISFIIAPPRDLTPTGNPARPTRAPAHDAFIRLLTRLESDPQTLWLDAQAHIDLTSGILVLDDSTLEKPYSPLNALVYRYWSGK